MAFSAVLVALMWPLGTTLGLYETSFSVCFANTNRASATNMVGRIRNQHRRTSHRNVFRGSFDVNVGEGLPTLRPWRADAMKIFTIMPRFLNYHSYLRKNAFRIFTSLVFALSLILFSIPVQSAWARNGNGLHSSLLDQAQRAPSSVSSSYYLQGNSKRNNPSKRTNDDEVASVIHTHRSQQYSPDGFVDKRRFNNDYSRRRGIKKRAVKRISLSILATTIAASSFRASLRQSKIVRKVTPFGIIRNQSPLGNGVSVIRVCVALGFDADGGSNIKSGDGGGTAADDDARNLLRRLHLEEEELHARKMILASQQNQLQGGLDAYNLRQKALGNYLSNVASAFLRYDKYMKYGSLDSMRVPFVEEAVKEFREIAREEYATYEKENQMRRQSTRQSSHYILATILLVIKGDHTSMPLPFGIVRRRDMARALTRIAKDAMVEDCLIASELMVMPDVRSFSMDEEGERIIDRSRLLTEKEILKAFPNLVPLT